MSSWPRCRFTSCAEPVNCLRSSSPKNSAPPNQRSRKSSTGRTCTSALCGGSLKPWAASWRSSCASPTELCGSHSSMSWIRRTGRSVPPDSRRSASSSSSSRSSLMSSTATPDVAARQRVEPRVRPRRADPIARHQVAALRADGAPAHQETADGDRRLVEAPEGQVLRPRRRSHPSRRPATARRRRRRPGRSGTPSRASQQANPLDATRVTADDRPPGSPGTSFDREF